MSSDAKYIDMDVQRYDLDRGDGFRGQAGDGIHSGNEVGDDSEFIHGLRAHLQVTLEEGTWAAWLYHLLKPHVTKLVVRNSPEKHPVENNPTRLFECRACPNVASRAAAALTVAR